MERILYSVFKDYGLDAVQIGVICYFGWKIMTNHLKHIQEDIKKIATKVENLGQELQKTNERISHVEGKLS